MILMMYLAGRLLLLLLLLLVVLLVFSQIKRITILDVLQGFWQQVFGVCSLHVPVKTIICDVLQL